MARCTAKWPHRLTALLADPFASSSAQPALAPLAACPVRAAPRIPPALERAILPQIDDIAAAARSLAAF